MFHGFEVKLLLILSVADESSLGHLNMRYGTSERDVRPGNSDGVGCLVG